MQVLIWSLQMEMISMSYIKIMQGRNHGTLFLADKKEEFYLDDIIDKLG